MGLVKRLATSESLAEIGHLRNVLEQAGIRCMIKNEQLSGALGEIPFLDCLPELWLLDEAQLDEARGMIEELRSLGPTQSSWRCPRCDETNEGQFASCWQCGQIDPLIPS
jgi:hypothetical protein